MDNCICDYRDAIEAYVEKMDTMSKVPLFNDLYAQWKYSLRRVQGYRSDYEIAISSDFADYTDEDGMSIYDFEKTIELCEELLQEEIDINTPKERVMAILEKLDKELLHTMFQSASWFDEICKEIERLQTDDGDDTSMYNEDGEEVW